MGANTEHYKAQAALCEEMSRNAPDEILKRGFRRAAKVWQELASGEPVEWEGQRATAPKGRTGLS